ncbi:MAG: serine hydrolase [Alistipes sp.]|nr:serine hydrolase [Alistipes sp.]
MRRSIRKFFGLALCLAGAIVCLVQCAPAVDMTDEGALPRAKATTELDKAFGEYLAAVEAAGQDLHSIMIVKDGKVVKEHWMGEGAPDKLHILNSVSKTFTSTAVGLAIAEGKLSLSDKMVDLFPDKLPAEVSDNLKKVEVRHLLTMSGGHDTEPSHRTMPEGTDWVEAFLAHPFEHEPGTYFWYNNMGTYMLSAIVQKVTGEKVIDYLTPRLFEPLAIEGATWQESPQGINVGGWGLYLKTEDLAKMGQLILRRGEWNGKQIVPAEWIDEMTKAHIDSRPAGMRPEQITFKAEDSDWLQGYGYQMWRCRHGAVRADGANGQYIIVMPEQNVVIAMTANIGDMQGEINLVWEHLLAALK